MQHSYCTMCGSMVSWLCKEGGIQSIDYILVVSLNLQSNFEEKEMTMNKEEKTTTTKVWENLQYIVLGLTIVGQVITNVPMWGVLAAQSVWLVSNLIATVRDFILKRPTADKVKNICLTGITIGLVILGIVNL